MESRWLRWLGVVVAVVLILGVLVQAPDAFLLLEIPFHLAAWAMSDTNATAPTNRFPRLSSPQAIVDHTRAGQRTEPLPISELRLLSVKRSLTRARCGICGEGFQERPLLCSSCGTPHHADCWQFNGRCSIYGCGSTQAVEAEARA